MRQGGESLGRCVEVDTYLQCCKPEPLHDIRAVRNRGLEGTPAPIPRDTAGHTSFALVTRQRRRAGLRLTARHA